MKQRRNPIARLCFLPALLLCAATALEAQSPGRGPGREREREARDMEYLRAEAVALPGDSAGLHALDILVWIDYPFILFTRTEKRSADSTFMGKASVFVTVRNKSAEKTQSQVLQLQWYCSEEATKPESGNTAATRCRFSVPSGTYDVEASIADEQSKQEKRITLTVMMPDFTAGRRLGTIIPVAEPRCPTEVRAVSTGRNFKYGTSSWCAIPSTTDSLSEWTFVCVRTIPERTEVFRISPSPVCFVRPVRKPDAGVLPPEFPLASAAKNAGYHLFRLPFDTLDLGAYELTAIASSRGTSDSTTLETQIVWPGMPRILFRPDDAVAAMRYILTEAELDEMKRGNAEERKAKFRRFWLGDDPTAGIKRMTEYFRRADEAFTRFQTVYMHNGIFSDRGKIYMMYGPPDDTHRVLDPGMPLKEMWTYSFLKRPFEFTDRNHDGNLKLSP